MKPFPPRRVNDVVYHIDIGGYVIPWAADNQPVLTQMIGSDDFFLPVFSTADKLREAAEIFEFTFASIKQVTDQDGFLDSLREVDRKIRIMIDPYLSEQKTVRFREILSSPH